MSRLLTVCVLVAFGNGLTCFAQSANDALPYGFGHEGPAGGPKQMLLRMPDVQVEMEMTSEQLGRYASILREKNGRRRTLFQNIIAGEVFEEPVDNTTLRELLDQYNRETQQQVRQEVLTDAQAKRLNQLALQLKGSVAAADREVAEKLGLSEAQMKSLVAARRTLTPQNGARTVRDANRQLADKLTANQQARLRQMQGTQFDFSSLRKYIRQAETERTEYHARSTQKYRSSSQVQFAAR